MSELDDKLKKFEHEIYSLKEITKFCESISKKLSSMYQSVFPKKCTCCGKVFETRDDYLKETKELEDVSTVFNPDSEKSVQEYRNCTCGSTILVMTNDRRLTNKFGVARRELFDICLKKMKKISDEDEETLVNKLRDIFQKVIQKTEI